MLQDIPLILSISNPNIIGIIAIACYKTLQDHHPIYLTSIAALSLLGVTMTTSQRFQHPSLHWLRAVVFSGIALLGVVPVSHFIWIEGLEKATDAISLWYLAAMMGFYGLGALFYALHIPERWAPGKFDYVLNSHQIFHVFVVLAAICHYMGLVKAFVWNHSMDLLVLEM
ncbi:hypothetical protein H4219_004243 [Mycoemilia scoparia]|uniref:Uncharacterized protein n=1 Tax=Mycoemilia scoparia TaxID=417184 RepID=A0A9W7ZXZ7_9FUNG|nr:hypothetical protein H4219_004243 [Mycoemilia scoparia]